MTIQEEPRIVRIDTAPAVATAPPAAAAQGTVPPTPLAPTNRPPTDPPRANRDPVATVTRSSGSRFEPDALIAAAVGLVWAMLGLIVIVRCGFGGPLATPVVETLGFTHTATLGLIEILFGLALLFSGIARSRSSEMTFAVLFGVAGFVGAVQHESFSTSLALETPLAWLAVLSGAGVALAALLMPRFSRRTNTVEQHYSSNSPRSDGA